MSEELLNILSKYDYKVSLWSHMKPYPKSNDNNNDEIAGYPFCMSSFPKKIIGKTFDKCYYIYSIQHDKRQIIIEKWEYNDEDERKIATRKVVMHYSVPIYCMRLFIITHCILICQLYNYDSKLIELNFEDEETSYDDLDIFFNKIYAPDDDENLRLEKLLCDIFVKSFSDNFSEEYNNVCQKNGVIDGYQCLSSLTREVFV